MEHRRTIPVRGAVVVAQFLSAMERDALGFGEAL